MRINRIYRKIVTKIYWANIFQKIGRGSIIYKPIMVIGGNKITIGDCVCIREMARIEIVNIDKKWNKGISIGNNVNIEQGVHIICQGELIIGDNVSITPYCVIIDTYHPYDPFTEDKVGDRLPNVGSSVKIGDGTFIGAHSIIMPNVNIGRGCIIGAGSIVTHDLPDNVVAMGAPAKVVKRLDASDGIWKAVNTVKD